MILFSNAKINIGLNIISKRPDGYHNLESIFYPIPWYDVIEILPASTFKLTTSGINIPCEAEKNLCFKAFQLIKSLYNIPDVHIFLHKNIPDGAGLGGGSSNASHTLLGLNQLFHLNLSRQTLIHLANQLGSDCAFFIENTPSFVEEKGNLMTPIKLNLSDYFLVVVKNHISVSTAWAYSQIYPKIPEKKITNIITSLPIEDWKYYLTNDFEKAVFSKHPELEKIKSWLYKVGAVYASMSGSGSAIYGIFPKEPDIDLSQFPYYWKGKIL